MNINSNKQVKTSKRLPPFGKPLAERLRFKNPPCLVCVCVGQDAWERAKEWAACPNDTCSLVLPPDVNPWDLRWTVMGCIVVIDYWTGPSKEQIAELVRVLLINGAESVTSYPSEAIRNNDWIYGYDIAKKKFVQLRETTTTYTSRAAI